MGVSDSGSDSRPGSRLLLAVSLVAALLLGAIALSSFGIGESPIAAWLASARRAGVALSVARLRWPQARLPAHSLCVLAIMKNETLNLKEWAAHYRWQGASAVVLLNNGGGDDVDEAGWRAELRGFEDFVTVLDAPLPHSQEPQYNDIGRPWLEARGCEFVAVLDLDEFLYVRRPAVSLRAAVAAAFDAAGAGTALLACPWLMFGSSGLVAHPRGSVRTNFTWRAAQPHVLHKSIARLASLVRLKAHEHETLGGKAGCPPDLALNHYAIQSREYFAAVKMSRGDVCCKEYEGVRTWDYFRGFDFREVEDTALRDLVQQEEGVAVTTF